MTPPIDGTLRKFQKRTREINALGLVLQGVDRALSGNVGLRVKIIEGGSKIAWTDGKNIHLNRTKVGEIFESKDLAEAILTFKGTNYHELAHVLFTPRDGDEISMWIKKNRYQYKWAWNALEDQRIETLYTALYPPTVPYFLNSTYTWLLEESFDSEGFYRVWSLIGGRKYVQGPVRDASRAAFAAHYGNEVTDRVDAIVDEYVTLPLPGRAARAIELVKEFHELLRGTDQEDYLEEHDCGSTGSEGVASEGEVDGEKAVEAASREMDRQDREKAQKAKEKAEKDAQQGEDGQDEDESGDTGGGASYPEDITDEDDGSGDWDEDFDDDDEDEGDEDAEGGQGGDQGDEESDEDDSDGSGSGAGEDDSDEDDENDGADDSSDGQSGDSAGEGAKELPEDSKDLAQDLRDAVADAQADVLTDENLQNDIDRTVDAFKAQADGHTGDEDLAQYTNYAEVEALPESIAAVQKITTELKKLRTDLEPRWQKERLSGRINVGGVIRNRADATFMEIFEEWDEGSVDQATTEVVIAIDLSASMDNALPQCSEALWVLKKSFDNADIRTTVLGFSDGNTVLYKATDKLRGFMLRQFRIWSGTQPRDSMLYAHRVLQQSDATNKVLITITDGVWGGGKNDGADPENVIRAIRQQGGTTLLFGVNGHRTAGRDHGFEQATDLTEIGDMVKIVHNLVHSIQEKAATR